MGFLGLACIFATLGAIDGPLLQRATSVVSAPIVNDPVQLNTSLVSELPSGLAGYWSVSSDGAVTTMFYRDVPTSYGNTSNNILAGAFDDVDETLRQPYIKQSPMKGAITGCSGKCRVKILAPALHTKSCTSRQISVDYTLPPAPMDHWAPPMNRFGYMSYLNLLVDDGDNEEINMITPYSQTNECVGTFNYTSCTLVSAVGEYDVTVQNDGISFNSNLPTIVSVANNAVVNHTITSGIGNSTYHRSTLAAIVDLATVKWASFGALTGTGTHINQGFPAYSYEAGSSGLCAQGTDPLPDMIKDLNELMFRVGEYVGKTSEPSTLRDKLDPTHKFNAMYTGQKKGEPTVFSTNFNFFIAAALLEGFCIAVILPTYYGWWRLGRSVSFSPLEIAKVSTLTNPSS